MKTVEAVKDIEQVARLLGLGTSELQDTVTQIHNHYRSSRRLIGSKERTLLIPSDHLKSVQRALLDSLLYEVPPHPASFCTPGRGILEAARRHLGHRYLLHLDIKNFFPSVRLSRVRRVFERLGFDSQAAELLTALTTFRNHLPQGAPSSVAVGNLVLARLDGSLWGLCRRFGLTYTRYVDDIAVSGGAQVQKAESEVRRIIADCHWELSEKGGLMGPDHRPKLLGMLLGRSLNVDPLYLADLRATLESSAHESVSQHQMQKLEGKLAWVRAVNPAEADKLAPLAARLTVHPDE